jgi:hypothetical protein
MIRSNGFWWIDLGPYWLPAVTYCVTKNDMANVPPSMPNSWPWRKSQRGAAERHTTKGSGRGGTTVQRWLDQGAVTHPGA